MQTYGHVSDPDLIFPLIEACVPLTKCNMEYCYSNYSMKIAV
jgi:hypothetical protein